MADPNNLGPILSFDESITAIASLLDEAKNNLNGSSIVYPLTSGFAGLDDVTGFIKFNRALAARVDVYRQKWDLALTDLGASFFDLSGDFATGAYEVFGTGSGDQLNSAYFPQNQNGEVRLSHPTFVTDMEEGDDRISKQHCALPCVKCRAVRRQDIWVYTSSTAPIPIVRNEELMRLFMQKQTFKLPISMKP